jgi:hypothetical protein
LSAGNAVSRVTGEDDPGCPELAMALWWCLMDTDPRPDSGA